MKMIASAVLIAALMLEELSGATAQPIAGCSAPMLGKDGKPIDQPGQSARQGCMIRESCEERAVDKNGKPLTGSARETFLKKCKAEG